MSACMCATAAAAAGAGAAGLRRPAQRPGPALRHSGRGARSPTVPQPSRLALRTAAWQNAICRPCRSPRRAPVLRLARTRGGVCGCLLQGMQGRCLAAARGKHALPLPCHPCRALGWCTWTCLGTRWATGGWSTWQTCVFPCTRTTVLSVAGNGGQVTPTPAYSCRAAQKGQNGVGVERDHREYGGGVCCVRALAYRCFARSVPRCSTCRCAAASWGPPAWRPTARRTRWGCWSRWT